LFHAARRKAGMDRQTDGRRDMTKLIVVFCNFAKAQKDVHRYW